MKKILVPTDFSETAEKALKYALKLAETFDAEIHLLNSFDVPHSGATLMINIDDLLEKESLKHLEACAERVKTKNPKLTVHTYSISGPMSEVVYRFSNNHKIDLIVMGTTGASGITGKIFGSNASSLIKNIKTPLLVIPNGSGDDLPLKIGIATDLKFGLTDNIYDPARQIALGFGSKVSFFNVNDIYKNDELEAIEKEFGTELDFVYGTDLEEGILEYLEDTKIDLLVLVSEKHNIFQSIFKPSMTKTMAKNLNIPMLILAQQ